MRASRVERRQARQLSDISSRSKLELANRHFVAARSEHADRGWIPPFVTSVLAVKRRAVECHVVAGDEHRARLAVHIGVSSVANELEVQTGPRRAEEPALVASVRDLRFGNSGRGPSSEHDRKRKE